MAGSVNIALVLGRLGKDPEIRNTQSGGKIATLSVATDKEWTQNGERKKETEWHKIVIFDERSADFVEKFLTKGATVHVQGEIKTRKWTDQTGQDRYTTEIVVPKFNGSVTLVSRAPGGEDREAPAAARPAPARAPAPARKPAPPVQDDLDDEIPF